MLVRAPHYPIFIIYMLLPSRIVTFFLVLELLNAVFLVFFFVCFILDHPEPLLLLLEPGRSTGMAVQPSWIEFSEQWLCSLRSEPLSDPTRVQVNIETLLLLLLAELVHILNNFTSILALYHITGILMIFQSLESNKLSNNLKSHLFREKRHSYFVKLKKNARHRLGLNA